MGHDTCERVACGRRASLCTAARRSLDTRHAPRVDRLQRLLDRQAGVATLLQLVDVGVTRSRIAAHVRGGRWQRQGRVVVATTGELTARQRSWVAVLNQPDPSALAGVTAATAFGLRGFDDEKVHVVVTRSAEAWKGPSVVVHYSRRLFRADVIRAVNAPPTVSRGRAFVDAAAWEPGPRRAAAILCAGVQQRIVTTSALTRALDDAGRVRHSRLLRAVIGDVAGGAQSFAEVDFARLAGRAGLPAPRRQSKRVVARRVRYLDVEFDGFVVEVDGSHHFGAASYARDLERHNDLVIGGDRVLRFSTLTIRTDPDAVVAKLREAHAAFGTAR
ncbi:MAG: hypothetical protein JWM93_1143 [Frankiales bacterium]|nr:hypothetical protein [Frankiales bacterium]